MVKNKKCIAAFLIAGLVFIGGTVQPTLLDFAKSAIKDVAEKTGITKAVAGVKTAAEKAITDVKNAILTVKGLATAFVNMVYTFNKKLVSISYYDDGVSVEVPLNIPSEAAAEKKADEGETATESETPAEGEATTDGEAAAAATRKIGLDYNFGFIGSGDITDPIQPVEALFVYTEPVKLAKKDMSIYASKFLDGIGDIVKGYGAVLKGTLDPLGVVDGISKLIKSLGGLLRMRPETIFKAKMLILLNAAQQGKDNVRWADVPVNLVLLLGRLAISVNEEESANLVVNKGVTDPSKWTEKHYFKDTGISTALRMKDLDKIFPLIAQIFDAAKAFQIQQWMVTEWTERKGKKGFTDMESAYSGMRSQKGHLTQSSYFLVQVLPLLDKGVLDKTDQELFVRAIRVHVARRYQGILSLFNITKLSSETTETEKKSDEEEMNALAQAKAVYVDRWAALKDLLEQSQKKMREKSFSSNLIAKVESLTATIKAEQEQYSAIFKDVTWSAKFPEGMTLDSVGVDENPLGLLSDDKLPKMIASDPLLEAIQSISAPATKTDTAQEPAQESTPSSEATPSETPAEVATPETQPETTAETSDSSTGGETAPESGTEA